MEWTDEDRMLAAAGFVKTAKLAELNATRTRAPQPMRWTSADEASLAEGVMPRPMYEQLAATGACRPGAQPGMVQCDRRQLPRAAVTAAALDDQVYRGPEVVQAFTPEQEAHIRAEAARMFAHRLPRTTGTEPPSPELPESLRPLGWKLDDGAAPVDAETRMIREEAARLFSYRTRGTAR